VTVYSIKLTLESVEILDDSDVAGPGEIFVVAKINDPAEMRSQTHSLDSGQTLTLGGASWTKEVVVWGRSSVPIEVEVFDEDVFSNESLGSVSFQAASPWGRGSFTQDAPSGKFRVNWTLGDTQVTAGVSGPVFVSRNHDGSLFVTTLARPPLIPVVKIIEIQGLYKPGVDDRSSPAPGTTKNSGYVPGYWSDDDKGRVFTNRALDGTWSKDSQYIELTAEVELFPSGSVLPPNTKIRWTRTDPDDPSNEPPGVHKDAGRLIDPNDYNAAGKTGPNPGDNDPRGAATASESLEEVDPLYALSGDETLVDSGTKLSKVRFHVSDIAGDNYRIKAEAVHPSFGISIPFETGIITVWDRVEIEYVKMASATDLPVTQIAAHYEISCVQVDVSERREVSGAADKAFMGATDAAAYNGCDNYCSSAGEFTHEGDGGWFFMVAARHFQPPKSTSILYEGNAEARDDVVRLPLGTSLASSPAVVRVFNAARIAALSPPKPNDPDIHIKFRVTSRSGRDLDIAPHDFHDPGDAMNSFLDADLSHYGFAHGSSIPVQVMSEGDDALVVAGISPGGTTIAGHHYFGGKLMVFTDVTSGAGELRTLCHELCHAFDNAHKCGNWDWQKKANRTGCCMNYWFQFILDDSSPRAPIQWTQNRLSAEMCGPHLVRIRDYHLEDNPGLGW